MRQTGDQHWTRRRKAAGLPAGNLNAPRWCVVYKDGSTWRRTDPVRPKSEAVAVQRELARAGYQGHVEDYDRSVAIGLPEEPWKHQ